MSGIPDMFAADPRPEVEAARLEMLRTEAEADRLGAMDYGGRVPEGHPAYEAEGRAIEAHEAWWQAIREPEAGPGPDGSEWDEPEWDSEDSNAYQARVEAGLEPEAEA